MSCNGCRVLRKGCSEGCPLRACLQWMETAEAQGFATLFLAKFFGRAGLMEFITAVPLPQRSALFQSLLYEACGRTVNPVHGAVGLLWSGQWHLCQEAVSTVLKGGNLHAVHSYTIAGSNARSALNLGEMSNFDINCNSIETVQRTNSHNGGASSLQARRSGAAASFSRAAPEVINGSDKLRRPPLILQNARSISPFKYRFEDQLGHSTGSDSHKKLKVAAASENVVDPASSQQSLIFHPRLSLATAGVQDGFSFPRNARIRQYPYIYNTGRTNCHQALNSHSSKTLQRQYVLGKTSIVDDSILANKKEVCLDLTLITSEERKAGVQSTSISNNNISLNYCGLLSSPPSDDGSTVTFLENSFFSCSPSYQCLTEIPFSRPLESGKLLNLLT
ncbi:hypothetical protein L7F22_054168 [Adiantum nelumboides]|nr:hypothetical protein [Adiantum nelumboides]MCO5600060.1 hypothetical protein [Adiantum nelumboides]